MKKETIFISAVLFAIAFYLAAGRRASATGPYLDGSKSIAQTWIVAENKGIPDKADVTITITGKGDPVTEVVPQDVVLAIDSSGSMETSDPKNDRLTAAKFYVNQLDINLGEKAAVVDFDDYARLVNDHHLSTDYPQVKNDIDTIDSMGSTNIPDAMTIANDELAGYGDPNHVRVVILLTDGQNWCYPWGTPCPELDRLMDDINDPLIQEAINSHITYYTIGLGSEVNETLLTNLAVFTGGQYYNAPDPSYLQEIYDKIHQRTSTPPAGKNITVTEVLTPSFDYVQGSFSIAPAILTEKVATWTIPALYVDDERIFAFQVKSSSCGAQRPVDGDTTVEYTNTFDEPATLLLPPVFVDVTCDLPPELSGVPADETVECDAVPEPASPTGAGQCDTNVDIAFEEFSRDGSCPGEYTLTRTWTANDFCGNTTIDDQVITVRDTVAPVISGLPSDLTMGCDSVPPPASPTAADNCDPSPGIVFDEKRMDGDCPHNYTLTRTWTAVDICGNASTQLQIDTVRDARPPAVEASFEAVTSDEDEDETTDGLYTIRLSGQDNCALRVDMRGTVDRFGNDERCDENPDFIGYAVHDGDRVKLNCSKAVGCVRNDEWSDEGPEPVVEITGPAMRLSATGTDDCRNSAKAESLLICPDPGDCITAITLQNSKGEEKTFYWFEYSGSTRDFEVGGEIGRFDWDCKTCLNAGDMSGTLRVTCLQTGKKMARRCKVPEDYFSAPCPVR